jgi:excisionase family DNA binding protein
MQTRPAPERMALTIGEAAALLGIGRSLAYEMARSGALPTVLVSARRRVPVKALELLLEVTPPAR